MRPLLTDSPSIFKDETLAFLLNQEESKEISQYLPDYDPLSNETSNPSYMGLDQLGQYSGLNQLSPIHIKKTLDLFPSDIRQVISSLLPIKLQEKLDIQNPHFISRESVLYEYLSPYLQAFYEQLGICPNALMTHSELEALLIYDQDQILELANYLGLCALAPILKSIIKRSAREAIKNALKSTPYDSFSFIRYIQNKCLSQLTHPLNFHFPLRLWDEKEDSLCPLLNKYGFSALSYALNTQPTQFIQRLKLNLDDEVTKNLKEKSTPLDSKVTSDLHIAIKWILSYMHEKDLA